MLTERDKHQGSRAHRNAALLLWFWASVNLPAAEPIAGQLVDIVTARNNYGYQGRTIAPSQAADFGQMVKQMRLDLGDEPLIIYERKMAEVAAAGLRPRSR